MSAPPGVLRFLDFTLDAPNARLTRGSEVLALRPKTLAVLVHLAARPGCLVTKQELLDDVWADTAVGEWVLSGCIRELRRALGDDSRTPRIIETAHRRGYRFIATMAGDGGADAGSAPPSTSAPAARPVSTIVGRSDDVTVLTARLARALRGERQIVLVAGEAGIGKTTLVDAFCAEIAAGNDAPWIARGQCLQQYGESEPYLPVLDALTRLATTPTSAPLRASLRRHAPAWVAQIPALLELDDVVEVQRTLVGATRDRMLREATGLFELLDRPLVLILEDLHWSDYATLDLLTALARRRDPASLLVIGTYRPADVIVRAHPLRAVVQELAADTVCHQLWLENLTADDVERYLAARFPDLPRMRELAAVLYERTDGNPLFMRSVVDGLVERGALVERAGRWAATIDPAAVGVGVPDGLAQTIQRQIDQLDPLDRRVLEAASVVGRAPSAAAVAAALDEDAIAIEERLDALARRGPFVRALGEVAWPDGTRAGGFELTHALYQSVLRDGVSPARRRQLHQRIAERLEAAHAGRRDEVAAELALHFEEAGDIARAVPYLEETARRAVSRGANREATAILTRALEMLDRFLPPSNDRTLYTIRLSLALGMSRQSITGFADPDVERAYERARVLSTKTDDVPQLFQSIAALAGIHMSRAELDQARVETDRLQELAARIPFPGVVQVANLFAGMVRYHLGPLTEARGLLERALAFDAIESTPVPMDFRVQALAYLGLVHLHSGRPDEARSWLARAHERAASVGTPFDRALAASVACFAGFALHDFDAMEAAAATAIALGEEHGFTSAIAIGKTARGRALVERGAHESGLALVRAGVDGHRASGQMLAFPTQLAILAEAHAGAGDVDAALHVIDEAKGRIAATGDVRYQAEIWRLEGALRADRREPAAETCFERAVAIAGGQGARWLELRARTSLVAWRHANARPVDRETFAAFVAAFTEGANTADVTAARRVAAA